MMPDERTTQNTHDANASLDAFRDLCQRWRWIRRRRTASVLLACALLVAAALGTLRPRVLTFFDRVSIGAMNGCLTLGVHRELPPSWNMPISRPIATLGGLGRGVVGVFAGSVNAQAGAWRPYHAAGWSAHHVVIPLWQPLALAVLGFGWSHGFLRGMRWRDPRLCMLCGHRLLQSSTTSSCAECGLLQTTGSMPRQGFARDGKLLTP